jgi:hypothetical protein
VRRRKTGFHVPFRTRYGGGRVAPDLLDLFAGARQAAQFNRAGRETCLTRLTARRRARADSVPSSANGSHPKSATGNDTRGTRSASVGSVRPGRSRPAAAGRRVTLRRSRGQNALAGGPRGTGASGFHGLSCLPARGRTAASPGGPAIRSATPTSPAALLLPSGTGLLLRAERTRQGPAGRASASA